MDYRSKYPWALEKLLTETSGFTSSKTIVDYRKAEHKKHPKRTMFGREHDRLIRIVPCGEGEPVCSDESTDPEGPFCFFYSTLFQIILLCLPLFSFERALLTEINVVPAELHPNSWAFVRTFSILGSHFGVDVFLYFFEAKRPGRTL